VADHDEFLLRHEEPGSSPTLDGAPLIRKKLGRSSEGKKHGLSAVQWKSSRCNGRRFGHWCRGGAAKAFAGISVREAIPGRLDAAEMDGFIRDSAMPFFHLSCTARMGHDPLSVVSGDLQVYGVSNLTIADASVMPRITSVNTMASCVIIGERAADMLLQELS
jgi:choline dehydrogenase-like flavoprotein